MEGYMQIISDDNYITTSKQPHIVAPLASKQCGTGDEGRERNYQTREREDTR
jgi:hypothetical protein